MKLEKASGFTLLELLMGTITIMILISLMGFRVRGTIQRAKVTSAKATINAFAASLGMIKDDTGLYPVDLSDVKEADPPEGSSYRYWCGPYVGTLSLTDPWKNPYFYELGEGIVFGPDTYRREAGPPFDATYNFSAPPGDGTLRIDNFGVIHAGWVWLNGVQVVFPEEFQDNIPVIDKLVTLADSSSIRIRLTSNPTHYIILRITSPRSKNSVFSLGSYGRDGEPGGEKYAADIMYRDF